MSTSLKWRTAEESYHSGYSLYQEKLYEQALTELLKAERAFRTLDARGHPWGHPLENGVSGLANTLALLGGCYQELGQYDQALTCYETSGINKKFERRKPFQAFHKNVQVQLLSCYEHKLSGIDKETLDSLLANPVEIDTSFKFPFSLTGNSLVIARLYELAPARYPHFKEFYFRARTGDAALRREGGGDMEETRMKRATFSIWTIFGILWIIYSMIVIKTLVLK